MAAARTSRAATTTLLGRLIVAPCCRSAAAAWSPPGAVGGSGRWSSAAPAAALPLAGGARTFAASASPAEDLPSSASERVTKVASEILSLNLLEVRDGYGREIETRERDPSAAHRRWWRRPARTGEQAPIGPGGKADALTRPLTHASCPTLSPSPRSPN